MDLDSIYQILQKLSLSELKTCHKELGKIIKARKAHHASFCPGDFIESHPNFIEKDSVQYSKILSELETLDCKSADNKTVTKWLTSTGEQYVWSSTKTGQLTVKEPINISEYPGILHLMRDINDKFGTTLNSCLVSHYKNGKCCTRFHADDETSLDKSQGIFVASFGASRTIDLNKIERDNRGTSDFSLKSHDCSVYVMKPGCQDHFVHRVRHELSVTDGRYSISFRCMIPKSSQKEGAVNAESLSEAAETQGQQLQPPPHLADPVNRTQPQLKLKRRKTTVLFGTSVTKFIQAKRLGLRGRNVVNVSVSGAKINDITSNVRDFYENHTASKNDDIEKVIFSLGTNDVKFSKRGISHLKKHLIELVDTTKFLFPSAIILFQCCLPIKCIYPYIARNVLEFNCLLRELCDMNNCVYIDCFRDFLSRDGNFANHELYHDWLHLNMRGVSFLGTWLKFIVNENSFNKVVNNMLGF